jgi:hypothetical protein
MKKLSIVACITLCMTLFQWNDMLGQEMSPDQHITKMLKAFYTSYITEKAKVPLNLEKINSIKSKYCTPELLKQLEKKHLDYDPFLKTSDSQAQWINTINITKDFSKIVVFNVTYINDRGKPIIIKIKIARSGEDYFIDGVF